MMFLIWNAPEPKAHVHYCDHTLSVVWLSLTFHIFDFLTRSKISMSSTKLVFLGLIGKTRWPPWHLIGWEIFDFTLWNRWTEFNETWQETRFQRTCTPPSLRFWANRQKRWPPWPLIGWDIFDFSSYTAVWSSTKLDRKQDLNVLYHVCVFGPIGKTRWPPWPLIGWDVFDFSSETAERNLRSLQTRRISPLNFSKKLHEDTWRYALKYDTKISIYLRLWFFGTRPQSWHVAKFLFLIFRPLLLDIKPQLFYSNITFLCYL